MEFKPFPKIDRLSKAHMSITQKIHGTNAQIVVYPTGSGDGLDLIVGSRTRWITPENDNYGFAKFVHDNKQEFIEKLGVGQHFGEWAGPGINSGEGLSEKTFVLFDHWKFPVERPLPPRTKVVPVLYLGPIDFQIIPNIMASLRDNGSELAPGFMRPEGIVVMALGVRSKMVFNAEETAWQRGDGKKEKLANMAKGLDVSKYFQPIRLEKLLSRDEKYRIEYPNSLPKICSDYIKDLIEEGEISGTEDEIRVIKKAMGSNLFKFVKENIKL